MVVGAVGRAGRSQVIILGAICMLISSWKRSLHAYGMKTWETFVLFLRQALERALVEVGAIIPQRSHTWTRNGSEHRRTLLHHGSYAVRDHAIALHLAKRRPPSRARSSIGCRATAPPARARARWILSSTMCFRRW